MPHFQIIQPGPRRRRAFTLAEVLMAILFVSIALFGFVSLQGRLLHGNRKMQIHRKGHAELQDGVATAIYSLEANPSATPTPVHKLSDSQLSTHNLYYSTNEGGLKDLTRVRVQAIWRDDTSQDRVRELETNMETLVGKENSGW